jgi:hypothetical protein
MLYYMFKDLSETENIIFILIGILIVILLFINRNKIFSGFENNTVSSNENSDLDENGFIKNELKPSYWYNYAPSEIRSKCFDCDASSNEKHPSNCFDCEIKGGRPIDKLYNRVLSR